MRPSDTSPEAWRVMLDGLRAMTPQQKVLRALSLTKLTHEMALAGIRERFPCESEREHRLRLLARFVDAETMRAAFEWQHD